jgi:general nucleoside transport system ATP-binding protein
MRIDLVGIDKSFGPVRANVGVSLSVEGGSIHGLLGENGAGKTTLMKILSGYQPPDAGTILLDGAPVAFASPAEAIAHGIGMLHQDPLDVPAMSVLDNFCLGLGGGILPHRRRAQRALFTLCRRFGLSLQPNDPVSRLTVGERQQLELVRLLALGVRVIILDEPTTGISAPQKELLFETLRRLAAEGLTVIFVSHKLEEVEALCARATVLRNGRVTGAQEAPFYREGLVQLMFGRAMPATLIESKASCDPVLEVRDLTVRTYRLDLEPVSLQACAGEVIGLAGLEGSGQRLFMQACAGIQKTFGGSILLDGRDMTNRSYFDFLRAGVALVPAARLEEGMIGDLTLREHFALASGDGGFFVDWEAAERLAQQRMAAYNVVGTPLSQVRELSGGNQQRALLALLPEKLRVLILEHPTRGLDMGSERWVWQTLHARAEQGTVILFTSTDLGELVDHSDRIMVFSGGRASQPVASDEVTREALGYMIGGVNL